MRMRPTQEHPDVESQHKPANGDGQKDDLESEALKAVRQSPGGAATVHLQDRGTGNGAEGLTRSWGQSELGGTARRAVSAGPSAERQQGSFW